MPRILKEALKEILPQERVSEIESGIDVIGDIAILRLDESLRDVGPLVGQAVLNTLKNVKVVLDQQGPVEGDYRLRKLQHLAGEARTLTLHKENNCLFWVDVETCYFSPRLSTERLRVADAARDGETILNMFAGVGPFSILLAKRKDVQVCSNELNKAAYDLHLENNRLNKVGERVKTLNDDAANLPSRLTTRFDRVIMPHPSAATTYIQEGLELLKSGGCIYYYRHISAPSVEEGEAALRREVDSLVAAEHRILCRRVRVVGPRLQEMVAEISVSS